MSPANDSAQPPVSGSQPTEADVVFDSKQLDSFLEEYKLAVKIQQSYHDVFYKSLTIYIAITAISLSFVFRENVFIQLKIIFCWFNLIFSIFLVISLTGFFIIVRRIARRMDLLANTLGFSLRNHYALSYGLLLTLISAVAVFIFWFVAIILRFWNLAIPTPGSTRGGSLF